MFNLEKSKQALGNNFQNLRNSLRLSVAEMGQLFETSFEFIYLLEQGEIPELLDEKLFKLLLAAITLGNSANLLADLLVVAQKTFPNLKLDSATALFNKLFIPNFVDDLSEYPWVNQTVKFRCRLLQLTHQTNGILLWVEEAEAHNALVRKFPSSVMGHLNLIDNHTVIIVPKMYLFLKLNTTKSQLPIMLLQRFNEKLPIGLSIPKEHFLVKSPSQVEVQQTPRRLFIFSLDNNSVSEIVF